MAPITRISATMSQMLGTSARPKAGGEMICGAIEPCLGDSKMAGVDRAGDCRIESSDLGYSDRDDNGVTAGKGSYRGQDWHVRSRLGKFANPDAGLNDPSVSAR